ncbi:anti-sigma factor RsiW [Kibdelosporangium banguiense]|uniref:Anti-sigma factor RsiW n=1 Tax=Kibdelosporangium banguiense TaxID=1365924 RepID=A0ABS4TQ84_9PSEU|nr:zf-HC2 domain-containing protein [Kibdelosporangium banguiense]MBP2326078.1 anti-sigma factor RsiW [Kibdelosporangium banguiense]
MSTQADPYRDWDVAYVLGSLSPAERREFEDHLSQCPSCAAEVGTLAGMPGILSAVNPGQAIELLDPAGPAPETVPPRPPRPAHSSRRRGRVRFAVGFLAAAAAGAALTLALQSGTIASPAEKATRTTVCRAERD